MQSDKIDFLNQCASFLEESTIFTFPSDSRVYYMKSLMAYQRGDLDSSQELLNQAEFHGLENNNVRLDGFREVLYKVEKRISKDDKLSVAKTKKSDLPIPRKSISVDNVCHICEKVFKKTFTLKRHLLIHSGVKNHVCSICEKSFAQKHDLDRHLLTHGSSYNFKCSSEGCDKSFKTLKNMRVHLKLMHTTLDYDFVCDFCGKSFKSMRNLSSHIKLHQPEKNFKCNICQKEFATKSHLKSHQDVHNEIGFKCNMCEFYYKRKSDLKGHVKRIHQTEDNSSSFIEFVDCTSASDQTRKSAN